MLQPGLSVRGVENVLNYFQIESGNGRVFYGRAKQPHLAYANVPQNLGTGAHGEIHTRAALARGPVSLIEKFVNTVFQIVAVLCTVQQNNNPTAFSGHLFKRMMQRPASGILAARAKQVPKGIGNMDTHVHRLICRNFTVNHGKVRGTLNNIPVGAQFEYAVFRIELVLFNTFNGAFVGSAIVDQVRDGADFELVLFSKTLKILAASHRPIIIHDFTDNTRRLASG